MKPAAIILPLVLLTLPACGQSDAPSGSLTPEQNAALDQAAETLDAQRADLPKGDDGSAKEKAKP